MPKALSTLKVLSLFDGTISDFINSVVYLSNDFERMFFSINLNSLSGVLEIFSIDLNASSTALLNTPFIFDSPKMNWKLLHLIERDVHHHYQKYTDYQLLLTLLYLRV